MCSITFSEVLSSINCDFDKNFKTSQFPIAINRAETTHGAKPKSETHNVVCTIYDVTCSRLLH